MSHHQQQRERCVQCSKIVYPQERLTVDSQIYHKLCLRCKTCNSTLAIHNYVNVRGVVYCKRHVPHESSGPKINIHSEVSPRPAAETLASGVGTSHGMPPVSPRNHYPPTSPRGTYPQPPLSPRVPAQPLSSPLRTVPMVAPQGPKAPAISTHTAPVQAASTVESAPPTVLVHTSSNHVVSEPEVSANATAGNIPHSASSEEEDGHASSSPSRSDKPKSDSTLKSQS